MKIIITKHSLMLFCLLCLVNLSFSQDSTLVQGKIVTKKDKPLSNISVSIEGSDAIPVITNENGEFKLYAPSGKTWLIINPVGDYVGKRIYLNNRKQLVISLPESELKSGYDDIQLFSRSEKRRDIVGSFSDIDIGKIAWYNITTIDQVFQGKVPGMISTNHSGMPGQGVVSYIRGINSMNTSNSPLLIVDGIPLETPGLFESTIEGNSYNPLTTIDPSDVSKINILKDPALTSIYGSKASNGVIFVQTVQPKATQTLINFSLQSGLNVSDIQLIPQLNNGQYKSFSNEMLASSFKTEDQFQNDYPGLYVNSGDDEYYRYMHNTNWQKKIFTNSLLSKAYLSVKGGSDIATYGLSIGYFSQGGIYTNTNYDRFNVRLVSDLNVFPWLKMKVNANLANNNSSLKGPAISPQTNPVLTSLFKPPIMSSYQYDDNGNQLQIIDDVDELGTSNPTAISNNFEARNKNYRFISSIGIETDITDNFKWNSHIGLNFNTMKEFVYMPNKGMELYYDGEAINVSQRGNNYLFSIYNDNYLNFQKEFNTVHKFDASLGFRVQGNKLQVDFGEAQNLPENDKYNELQSGQNDLRIMGGINSNWNWMSFYNQMSYKYMDKYILNTGLSADFSTQTGDQAQTELNIFGLPFGFFYSAGVGWRISEESMLDNLAWLEKLLVRVSYGTNGNDDIGNFSSLDYYILSKYRETSSLIPGGIANETLKFEKIKQFNAGLDLSVWGDRTQVSFDYFIKVTEDMLIYEPQEGYIGFEYMPTNGGEIENKGYELSIFHRLIDGQHFKWDISSSISFITNEVIDLKGTKLVTAFLGGEFLTEVGLPLNSFYGYQYEGVYSTFEEAENSGLVNEKGIPYGAGDAIFKDVSGPEGISDGIINDYDKVNLGSPNPDYFGSFSNSFQYNQWSLDIMVQFVFGNEIFNYVRYMNERMIDLSNQSTSTLNRWQKEGDVTDVPRALWNDPIGNADFSSRWIEDGSYIRLKNLTLGYNIPEKFLIFKNASVFLTATNLFTFDKYLGYDPEFSHSFSPLSQGIDYGLMPQYRKFLIGITFGL